MKTYIVLFSLCLGSFLYSQKNTSPCSAAKIKKNNLKSNTLSVAQIAKSEAYDVHFYKLDLNMDNLSTQISGTVDIHGKARVNLDTVLFELFDDYTISDLRLNGSLVTYKRIKSCISVPCNFSPGQTFVVSVTYNGTAPSAATNPLGGGGLTNDNSPSWGNSVTWTLSEPFSAYEWFPCKQSLKDKADSVEVHVTVPSACKAGSNGILTDVIDLGNGKSKYIWKQQHPIDYYLISVAVAEYVDYSIYATPVGSPQPILIQNYVYNNPATLNNFKNDIDETVDFINYYSDIFGLYPFYKEKYGHCMAPLGGGMEHQTMTTLGYFNNTLTAHELAHQWWGDHVTCGSWADIWLNEGFASYSEYLMLAEMYPGDEVIDMDDRHNSIMSQPDGSIWVEDSLNADRVFSSRLTYNKGAAFIHTLRFMVNNDSLFFQTLRNFQQKFAFSTALTADFKNEMELVSGIDLTKAFEEWYYGEGFPSYGVRWNFKNDTLIVKLIQSVSAAAVTPFFTNPLQLSIQRSGQADTLIRVTPDSDTSLFYLPGLNSVTNIKSIDPQNWIVNADGPIVKDTNLLILVPVPGDTITENPPLNPVFTIFPNPAAQVLHIQFGDSLVYVMKMIDAKGALVLEKEVSVKEDLNLTDYSKGMYLFQFESMDGKRIRRKIVKI